LLANGYRVVLAGRRQAPLDAAVAESGADPALALAHSTDVGDQASVRALFDHTEQRFGRLDLLFNNAGMGTPAMPIEDIPFELWQSAVAVNLTGAFLCTQQALRLMKPRCELPL